MTTQLVFTILNDLFLIVMGVISLLGTSALVELMINLLKGAPRHTVRPTLEPEDA